jgi:hypothetical protein
VRLAQHGQQRMMAGPSVFARVVSFERTFLFAITFKDGRIQVQRVAFHALRQTLHLPFGQRRKQALHLSHAESAKQIADGVIGGKTLQAQERMQRAISSQQTRVSEASGSHQHRYQKGREGGSWINVIRRPPADRHVLPNRFHEADFVQEENENRDPAKWVTARCVSRRINRSSDNKASISRGTGLSAASDSIPLLSQILARYLTANFGFPVYKIVRRHTGQLRASEAGPERHHVSPHVFRHSCAVHMLEAGVDVNVIRGWLGHVSLDTTNRYAEITVRAKEAALRLCEPPTIEKDVPGPKPVWRDDETLLAWLASL